MRLKNEVKRSKTIAPNEDISFIIFSRRPDALVFSLLTNITKVVDLIQMVVTTIQMESR